MALVVTIIILLILAGISIGMLSGDNSIINQAGNAKAQTDIAGEKEIIDLAVVHAMGKSKYGDITKDNLDNELNKYSEIESTEQTDKGIVVTFKSNRQYLVDSNGDVSSYSDIKIGNLVVKDGNTVLAENCKSVQLGKSLTISFDASIANGQITSITPNIAYTTAGERSKTFTIIGKTSDGQEITKEYTLNLSGYYNIPELKVGDFVNYALKTPTSSELTQLNNDIATFSGATDNTTKTAPGSTLLCRVLEIDETTGNPTKLISADGVNSLSLYGANGYNNAVYLINEMCKTLYSGNQGTTTSLTIEDLEKNYFSDAAIKTRDKYSESVKYGETKYYTGNCAKYPNISTDEARMGIATPLVDGKNQIRAGGLDLSEQITTYTGSGDANMSTVAATNKGITITQTYYRIQQGAGNYKNVTLNNILHQSPTADGLDTTEVSTYWLASRCANTWSDFAFFPVYFINSNKVGGYRVFNSDGTSYGVSYAIRPVILLAHKTQIEYSSKYNNTYNIWNLN